MAEKIVAIYARQDLSEKNSIRIEEQLKYCYEEVQENNDDDDLIQYIIYEDRHWGVCNKLVGYETMLKDLNKKAFVELYYYGRKTLLGNKYEHFNDLYKFQKQRVKLYNADICGITLI